MTQTLAGQRDSRGGMTASRAPILRVKGLRPYDALVRYTRSGSRAPNLHLGPTVRPLRALWAEWARGVAPVGPGLSHRGEEFVVLLGDPELCDALLVAQELRRTLASSSVLAEVRVTVSVGVASLIPVKRARAGSSEGTWGCMRPSARSATAWWRALSRALADGMRARRPSRESPALIRACPRTVLNRAPISGACAPNSPAQANPRSGRG